MNAPRLDGATLVVGEKRVPLMSGALHYWRLPRVAWRDAITAVAELGLPIIETYVPWGVHEREPGDYDFGETDPRKDLGAFLDLVHESGHLAFVRPGPHINAELTFFGLPERIVFDKRVQARSPKGNSVPLFFPPKMFPVPSYASAIFHREVGDWYDAVGEIVAPRLWPNGPVVLLQVDNEASFYFRNGPYCQDYHPDAKEWYRAFMRDKHGANVPDALEPPLRFRARNPPDLVPHLEWAEFHEHLIARSLREMRARMATAKMEGVPVIHNIALGEAGQPISLPAIEQEVDLVGLDYYHPAREHRTIKRRTLYLAGSVEAPYAPELGAGAPAWFTPLDHEDSLYCAMCALAFGLRGLNLYMAVDRDRWYGAPIDSRGAPREGAAEWRRLFNALEQAEFSDLRRDVKVALSFPREYARLARATHLLGPISPSSLEALGGSPVDGCRRSSFGFGHAVQITWWKTLSSLAAALTKANVAYEIVDSESDRLAGYDVVIAPTFEFVNAERWRKLEIAARLGASVIYGPTLPSRDDRMEPHAFQSIPGARRVLLDQRADVDTLASELSALLGRTLSVDLPLEATLHRDRSGAPKMLFLMNPTDAPVTASLRCGDAMRLIDVLNDEVFDVPSGEAFDIQTKKLQCRLFRVARPPSQRPSARARKTPS